MSIFRGIAADAGASDSRGNVIVVKDAYDFRFALRRRANILGCGGVSREIFVTWRGC